VVLLLLALLSVLSPALGAAPVYLLELKGGVDPGSADYIVAGIEQAQADGAQAVVLSVDTPGGLLTSAREIVQAELTSSVPVIVWVGPAGSRAASAGVFVTLAGSVAAMAPGTTIGAAHPVSLLGGGLGKAGPASAPGGEEEGAASGGEEGAAPATGSVDVMKEKVLNDTVAWARSIAEQRDRDPGWIEQSVRESVSITDREALERGVVDLSAPDVATLLERLEGRVVPTSAGPVRLRLAGAELVVLAPSMRQRVVHILGDPNLLLLFIGLGLLGLYVEINHPGLIVPGVAGAGLLVAAAVGMSLVPFNLGGLLLILFAFGAFALELYVGAHGAFAATGALSLGLGAVLLFEVPGFDLRVDTGNVIAVCGTVLVAALVLGVAVRRAMRRKVQTGAEGLVGAAGLVLRGGEGGGWVRVDGEEWRARWSGGLAPGAPVRVTALDGLTLEVSNNGPSPTAPSPSE